MGRVFKINSGDYLNFNNQSYINVMKAIYFITNYLIQLFFTLVFHTQVQEMHFKHVKIKSKIKPHRLFFIREVQLTLRQF